MASSQDLLLMVWVARRYHEGDHAQEKTATALNIPRPKVCRLLQQACQERIVQILIVDRLFTHSQRDNARWCEKGIVL